MRAPARSWRRTMKNDRHRADDRDEPAEHEHELVAGDVRVLELGRDLAEERRGLDVLEPLLLRAA